MTTYAYKCDDCSQTKDFQFPLGEAPETVIVDDSPHTFRRLVTAPSVHFSGEGFTRSSVGARTGGKG